jgi:glucan phosphoethanolaminetransferase (alkaline phosphatase superfamily)
MRTIFENPTGEDVMMEIEIIKQGDNILFNPYIKIKHIHPLSLIKLFRKAFQHGESTYLLGKYSNNFINWKHFAERGHIFHLKWVFCNLFLFISLLLIFILSKSPLLITIIIFFALFLIIIFSKLILTKNKLESILNTKGEEYKKFYKVSLLQLFYFNQIHFLTKLVALISFLYTYIKHAFFKKNINNSR